MEKGETNQIKKKKKKKRKEKKKKKEETQGAGANSVCILSGDRSPRV